VRAMNQFTGFPPKFISMPRDGNDNMKNFWKKFKKPILALAPMAGITDESFRYLCGKYGADVVYSEMVSATAMVHGSLKTWELMKVHKKNGGAKFIVQLFGNDPQHFAFAVKAIEKKIKPDGFDINFGCPAMKIIKSCAGAKLFQDLEQSRRVVEAVLRTTKLPVSVKIRAHAGKVSALQFIEAMKGLNISAIMIHGRTLTQGFVGEIDYGAINRLKKKFKGIVLANGGIYTVKDAEIMLKKTGADGLGIGQGACGNPQLFEQLKSKKLKDYKKKDVFKIALEHAKLMEKFKGKQGILEMRKHLCWYVKGMPGAAELRKDFVKVETLADVRKLLK
jgi:tRNA-dihydrouridine synthase B